MVVGISSCCVFNTHIGRVGDVPEVVFRIPVSVSGLQLSGVAGFLRYDFHQALLGVLCLIRVTPVIRLPHGMKVDDRLAVQVSHQVHHRHGLLLRIGLGSSIAFTAAHRIFIRRVIEPGFKIPIDVHSPGVCLPVVVAAADRIGFRLFPQRFVAYGIQSLLRDHYTVRIHHRYDIELRMRKNILVRSPVYFFRCVVLTIFLCHCHRDRPVDIFPGVDTGKDHDLPAGIIAADPQTPYIPSVPGLSQGRQPAPVAVFLRQRPGIRGQIRMTILRIRSIHDRRVCKGRRYAQGRDCSNQPQNYYRTSSQFLHKCLVIWFLQCVLVYHKNYPCV